MRKLLHLTFAVALLLAFTATDTARANSCSATVNCSGGGTKTCNGNSSCSVGSNSVTCDGQTTYCGCSATIYCNAYAYGPWILSCSTSSGTCSSTSSTVRCGSWNWSCSDCGVNRPCAKYCAEGVSCNSDFDCGGSTYGACTSNGTCICR